jgi:hypothetical protein
VLDYRPAMRTNRSVLAGRPLPQQHGHLLLRKALPELRRAPAGKGLRQVLASNESLERPEKGSLGVGYRLRGRQQAHRVAFERLDPESQGFELDLEVPHLRSEASGELDHYWSREVGGRTPNVLQEFLVENALVRPVLVEDDQLFPNFGPYAVPKLQTSGSAMRSPVTSISPPIPAATSNRSNLYTWWRSSGSKLSKASGALLT